jgi:hypothetical protein
MTAEPLAQLRFRSATQSAVGEVDRVGGSESGARRPRAQAPSHRHSAGCGDVPTDVVPTPEGRGAADVFDQSGAGSRDISYAC